MPQNPNGKKPPSPPSGNLHIERSAVKCQRCKRAFEHFMIEEIDDLKQLRCGDLVITEIEMTCLHCGWTYSWDVRRRDLSKMAVAYGELSARLGFYSAE